MLGKVLVVLLVILGWYAFKYFASFVIEPNIIVYLAGVAVGLASSWFLDIKTEWV